MLNKTFYSILLRNIFHIVIVCIGVSAPLKNITPSFLPSPPPSLNLQNDKGPVLNLYFKSN